MKTINLLGSTGSIGCNALEIVGLYKDLYQLNIISAGRNAKLLLDQIRKFKPKYAYLRDPQGRKWLSTQLGIESTRIIEDEAEYYELLEIKHDATISAIMGIAALRPTLHAVVGANTLGLANKEVIICAYPFLKEELSKHNTKLIPLDSEHNAIYQIIGYDIRNVRNVIITASGGPFYEMEKGEFYNAEPRDAVRHPNWKMGAKISVDTATLMNKGLEYIEACELFNLSAERVKILVHRTSKVHAIVNFVDGSSIMQVNEPNMKVHIARAIQLKESEYLNLPENSFNFAANPLTFEELDEEKFELPKLAKQVYEAQDLSMRIRMNNVNEVLVQQYLEEKISFGEIIEGIKKSILNHKKVKIQNLSDLFAFSDKIYTEAL